MNSPFLGLYTALYHVDDLAAAKAWYEEFLGKKPYFDEPFYVGFDVGGHELGLLPVTDTPRKEKGCVAYWGVPDIAATTADFEKRGHQLFEPVRDVGEGIKVATVLDADANVVGLIENPHFKASCQG